MKNVCEVQTQCEVFLRDYLLRIGYFEVVTSNTSKADRSHDFKK